MDKIINKKNIKDTCEKCNSNKPIIYNRNKFICYECFFEFIIHKFRSNLRTSCKIRHEDYVLICFSGGNNSSCMLHMFNNSFNEPKSNKKMFFKLKVLYIDDSFLLREKTKIEIERKIRRKFICNICNAYKFNYDILNLENIFDLQNCTSAIEYTTNDDYIKRYFNIYDKIPNKGGMRNKFVKITIQNYIFAYALKHSFTKVVYGNSGQGIVKEMFSLITTGNGIGIKHFSSHVDDFYFDGKIEILKPLKDFFTKEILYYNHYNKIDLIYPSYDEDKTDVILNNFFQGLQNTKINTVPSVLNTADKLIQSNNNCNKCAFCLNELNSPITSLEISYKNTHINNPSFNITLCYGCLRMFESINTSNDEEEILHMFSLLNNITSNEN